MTPTPPMQTGTARYFSLFLSEAQEVVRTTNCLIVTGSQHSHAPRILQNIPVVKDTDYTADSRDILVSFIANNEFHSFVYGVLLNSQSVHKKVTIIHDPQCFMNVDSMHWRKSSPKDVQGMREHIKYEMPLLQNWILNRWKGGVLPKILKYNLMAQSRIIDLSDVLVVHSYYSAIKLILESGHGVDLPPVQVMSHPRDPNAYDRRGGQSEKFVVGCCGWVSEFKRPVSVLKGFADFVHQLPEETRKSVELKFVGRVVDPNCDPNIWAQRLNIGKQCRVLGYVTDNEFIEEMSSINLLFNLRFPSCGETSGTLNLAEDLNIETVLSFYQSFKEEQPQHFISIDPEKEISEITETILASFTNWEKGAPPIKKKLPSYPHLPAKLTPAEVVKFAIRGS